MRYSNNSGSATEPDDPQYVRSEDFVRRTGMELVTLYLLLEEKRLPIKYIDKHLHVNVNDRRAYQYLPDYKIEKDLF